MSRNGEYPLVPLSEALVQNQEYITELEPRLYPKLSVKLYGKGVVLDEPADGASVRMKRHQLAKPGQVILSEIWAKKGAIGVVPEEGAGALVTSHFFLFDIDESKLLRPYVGWLLAANYFEPVLGEKARGTTGYAAIRPKQFLKCEILLPPLDEQRRIVARIEELAALIEEARELRVKAREEAQAFLPSAIAALCSQFEGNTRPLIEVLAIKPSNGWSPRCDNDPSGTPVLTLTAVTGFRYDGTQIKKTSLPIDKDSRVWLQKGDLLISRSNTPELVGHAAIYDGVPKTCIYPDLIMRTRVKEDEADVRFVHYWLMTPKVRDFIQSRARGTSPTMKKITQKDVMAIPFPKSISLAEQRHIVSHLDNLQAQADGLVAIQDATQAELEALLPSVLDKAFRGEL